MAGQFWWNTDRRPIATTTESGGLSATYRERPERDPKMPDRNRPEATFKQQVDPVIDFDFGDKAPEKGTYAAQFSITPLPEVRELTWAEAVRLIAQQEQSK